MTVSLVSERGWRECQGQQTVTITADENKQLVAPNPLDIIALFLSNQILLTNRTVLSFLLKQNTYCCVIVCSLIKSFMASSAV